ncbi:tail fiber domain-containing protein [Limosilactobacillus fermentum]
MPMDNVTLENTQQSISSRDAKSVASVMVNGKWVNLSDTLEQANVKSDVGTVAKQVAAQQEVVSNAVSTADSAVAYANDAIEKSRVNSQAIDDINSAVSDAASAAAVARSDGLRAWDAAQSNVSLIDSKYASASASISSARTEAIAAAKSDISVVKTDLASQATNLSSYAAQASAAGKDITMLKSQAGQLEQDMADTKGDVSQLKVSASAASVALSDAAGNISSLQVSAKSYSAALSDTNSNVATVTATASELETKYADAAGDINTLKADASGFSQTLVSAKGDISTLQATATGLKNTLTDAQGDISTLQSDVSGLKKTTSDHAGNIATLKQTASDFSSKVSGMETSLADANGKINDITSNGGGRNLLRNSDVELHGKAYGFATVTLTVDHLEPGETYTMSWYGKVDANATKNKQPLQVYIYNDSWSWAAFGTIPYTANEYQRNVFTFTVPNNVTDANRVSFYLKHYNDDNSQSQHDTDSDAGIGYVKNYMLEKGTVAHDWSPAPEDTDAKITANTTAIEQNRNAITLKADQTTVDKTNGTVQQLQSQLKVQADQIASKVSSSDLDAKGYATQTYTQTQVKQTADAWNANLTSVKDGLTQSYTNLHATVDGIQAQVYNSDGSSKITQLSNLIATKVSQGDYNSQITQLKNDINLRVQKGDVISQINQEAGGNTLIQVSNGNGSLILDAANTIVKGKEWIPVAAIADLTADQVQAGTLKGVKVDFRDSTGTGMIADGSTLTFDVSNTPAGYLSYNGMPVAELPDGSGGNELAIRYGLSTAIIPDDNSGAQATFSKAAQKIAYMTGTSRGKKMLSGLEVHSNNHHWLCAVNSDATCNRFEVNDRDGLNIAWHDQTHFFISDGNARLYKDNDDSPTATKLEVHGWAWVNGWVEAAGHSQHSALSTKTDIQAIDDDEMLAMVNNTDLASFLFKTDVASGETHRHIGLIIDDVHDVAQYQAPQDFIAPNGVSRDDDNMIGALFGAVKALTKRIKTLESKVG